MALIYPIACLFTTSMRKVFLRLGQAVLPGDAAFRERDAKGVVIQIGHAGALAERQPAGSVKAAGQLDLHVPFALAGPERKRCKGFFVQIKCHAHKLCLSNSRVAGIAGMPTPEDRRKTGGAKGHRRWPQKNAGNAGGETDS